MPIATNKQTNVVSLPKKISEILSRRDLLLNLVRKELKVRYKNSMLGFIWSMVNPLLYLVVFYVVFSILLPGGIPHFHVYLLAGLLPWTLFASAVSQATGSLTGNADLVKKVYFPRELLPFSAMGAAMFHFLLQMLVLAGFLIVTRYPFAGTPSLLIPAALLTQTIFMASLALPLSALNVRARDIHYLLEVSLLAWFWMTPIVYPSALVATRLQAHEIFGVPLLSIYLSNPMSRIVLAFQRGIYGKIFVGDEGERVQVLIDAPVGWYLSGLAYAAGASVLILLIGWRIFLRMDSSFAEEL